METKGNPGNWPANVRGVQPPQHRDLVPHAPYLASSFVSVGVQAKRGCSLHCIHCSDTFLLGHRVRMRPPVDVVDEMQALVEEASP